MTRRIVLIGHIAIVAGAFVAGVLLADDKGVAPAPKTVNGGLPADIRLVDCQPICGGAARRHFIRAPGE
jgi:hypothetical protein